MADELGRRIAQLVSEAESSITEAPERTWYEATVGHPGVASYRQKLPEQRLADMRRDYVLSRLSGEVTPRSESEEQMMRSNPGLYEAMEAYRGDKKHPRLSKDALQSPYQYTGVVGPGSGLHTANQWLQSGVGLALSASDLLANATNDATSYMVAGKEKPMYGGYVRTSRQAQEDAVKHLNTLTAPVQAALGISDVPADYSSWASADTARRAAAQNENWTDLSGWGAAVTDAEENKAAPDPTSEEHLKAHGWSDTPARWVGATMDNILNPLPPPLKAISAASRAGQTLKAARMFGTEMLPAYGLEAAHALSGLYPKRPGPDALDSERMMRKIEDMATGLRGGEYGRP